MHRLLRLACVAAVTAASALTLASTTTAAVEGPIARGMYGNPWAADGLGNLEIGKATGRQVSYRFRADATGTLTAVRVFFIYASGGYAAGNGGQVKISLQGDNGGLPNGVQLTSGLVTNPKASNFRTVPFAKPAALTSGRYYHLVFTNPAPSPTSNYVSIDDLWLSSTPTSTTQPAFTGTDLAVLLKYSSSSSWDLRRQHIPIFTLTYQDGSRHGPGAPYINARSSSGARTISGSSRVAQTMTPKAPVTASGGAFRVRRSSGSDPVTVSLVGQSGTLRSCTASVSGTNWARCTFASAYALSAGTTYRLVASTRSSSSLRAWPLTEESGMYSPWGYRDGYAQYSTNSGSSWSTPSTADDFQAYLLAR